MAKVAKSNNGAVMQPVAKSETVNIALTVTAQQKPTRSTKSNATNPGAGKQPKAAGKSKVTKHRAMKIAGGVLAGLLILCLVCIGGYALLNSRADVSENVSLQRELAERDSRLAAKSSEVAELEFENGALHDDAVVAESKVSDLSRRLVEKENLLAVKWTALLEADMKIITLERRLVENKSASAYAGEVANQVTVTAPQTELVEKVPVKVEPPVEAVQAVQAVQPKEAGTFDVRALENQDPGFHRIPD